MGAVDPSKLESIFSAAAAMPSADARDPYLRQACGSDAELRRQVDLLLVAHDKAGDFLSTPALGVATADPAFTDLQPTEVPGTRVGPYKLLQLIGEGGFGSVFMAEQERPVRRRVALKVIKLGMDTRQVVARFEAERQALAMMDHPNIAKVLDAGATHAGRLYFVMELVNGVPITQYCDANCLTARQRLELFVPVCNAVQHAHQKGVIHRDLKPNNVLVTLHDGTPVPKIIDFGIAKATEGRLTEKTLFTEFRQLVGTPEYMAPEQASMSGLDVDTRSDVYSLGVLLYELLTSTTPFDARELRSKAYGEIQRIIREVDPPRPSTRLATLGERLSTVAAQRQTEARRLGPLVRGELDWIVMRCLEKDRTRRYETAAALAEDVRRYLDSEPVLARPAGAAYRLRKFARRHRAPVAAGAAVLLALLLGIVGTTAGMLRARAAQHDAETSQGAALAERNAARASQRRAEQSAAEARREAQRATAVSDFMRGIFALAQPESGAAGGEAKVGELLRFAASEIDNRLAGQPEEQIVARATLAEAFQRLELEDQALEQLERAHHLSRSLPGGETSAQTLGLASELVVSMYVDGRGPESLELARSTYEQARTTLGELHPVTWRATHALALALSTTGDVAQSEKLWAGLVQRLRDVPRARTPDHLGRYLSNLASCLRDRAQYDEAIKMMREAAAILQGAQTAQAARVAGIPATAPGPNVDPRQAEVRERALLTRTYPDVIQSNAWIARLLVEAGRADEVTPLLEGYLTAVLLAQPQGTPTLTDRLIDLAHLKLLAGDKAAADRCYARALEMARRLRPTVVSEDNERWREWMLSCSPLPDGWTSPTWRQHLWAAMSDLLRDYPPGRLARGEVSVERIRFTLRRWPDGGQPVTAGSLDEFKALPEPVPGTYLLGLEVPRLGLPPLRRAAWLTVAPWSVEVHNIPRFESVRTRFGPRWARQSISLAGEPAERRSTSALALSDVPEICGGHAPRLHWFGLVARTRLDLPAGTYRLSASSDDGVRVYVDGNRVIDAWWARQSATNDAEVSVAAGSHELRVEFEQLVGSYHLWLQVAPRDADARAAAAALGGGVPELDWWTGALAAELVERPDDARALGNRAHALGRAGRFDESAAAYARTVRANPANPVEWYQLACVLAYLGDEKAWRDHARAMFDRFGDSEDQTVCEHTARALALLPNAPVKQALLDDLAEAALDPGPAPDRLPWVLLAKGLVDYRAGRHQESIDALCRCQSLVVAEAFASTRTRCEFVIAMALHAQGRDAEAAAAYRQANAWFNDLGIARVDDLDKGALDNWLSCHATRREAQAVFNPAKH
jgi:serine/threonine protein kinase